MRVTLAQIAPKLSRDNLAEHIDLVQEVKGKTDLIVFPELSLNGYMLLDKVYEDAFFIEELDQLKEASSDVDIAVGVALRTKKRIYNAAIYFSNAKVLHIHHKNHLPSYGMFEESRYFVAGSEMLAFETQFGRIAMVVCEDMWHASTTKRIADLDVDYLLVLTASPARGFTDEELVIKQQWKAILQTTALFGKCEVIFVNRVGFEDGIGFWGGSMVISHEAHIKHQLKIFEQEIQTFNLKTHTFSAKRLISK